MDETRAKYSQWKFWKRYVKRNFYCADWIADRFINVLLHNSWACNNISRNVCIAGQELGNELRHINLPMYVFVLLLKFWETSIILQVSEWDVIKIFSACTCLNLKNKIDILKKLQTSILISRSPAVLKIYRAKVNLKRGFFICLFRSWKLFAWASTGNGKIIVIPISSWNLSFIFKPWLHVRFFACTGDAISWIIFASPGHGGTYTRDRFWWQNVATKTSLDWVDN